MTNPTPHGQVPEALRLAEQYDHGDPAAHGNAWKAAVCTELRRLAELEAQIEALSGVQALSAAPAGWKLVPEDATEEMVRATDKVNFANADTDGTMHNVWNVMLAASPTPPAEQAAPKAAPGEQNESAYQRGYMDGMAKGRRDVDAAPQQEAQEPVAWESTTPGYIKYITQARYEKFSPAVRRWYKPYRCSGCAERGAGFDACDMATAAAQGFRRGQAAAKQEG